MSDLEKGATHVTLEDTEAHGTALLEHGSRGGSPRRETLEMVTVIQMLIEDQWRQEAEVPKIVSGGSVRWSGTSRKCGSRWRR